MSTNSNGNPERTENGQFRKGWRGGPGNPQVQRLASLRFAVAAAVTPDDILRIMAVLLEKAFKGDLNAIREVFDRTIGRPIEADLLERIAEMEALVAELAEARKARDEMARVSNVHPSTLH